MQRTAREIADEAVHHIEYQIQAHHRRERALIREVIERVIEADRAKQTAA